jgi:hypothetical protein
MIVKRILLAISLALSAYVPSAFGYVYLTAGCGTLNFGSGHMSFYCNAINLSLSDSACSSGGSPGVSRVSSCAEMSGLV